MDPIFLSLDEVLEIHAQQIERYGGSSGLRDIAGLESAVATPQATFGGEFLHRSVPAMAAAYLFHLCQNHAFIDGNKRVGANAAIAFLFMNGWDLELDETGLTEMVLSVAADRLSKAARQGFLKLTASRREAREPYAHSVGSSGASQSGTGSGNLTTRPLSMIATRRSGIRRSSLSLSGRANCGPPVELPDNPRIAAIPAVSGSGQGGRFRLISG
jgi:death-on-curing protein